ncbi:MAG: fatty acid desaturase [Polyangia bacterium]
MVSELTQKLVAQAKPDARRATLQLLGTLVPLGLLWALSFHVVQSSRLLAVALTPLAAALFLRVFVFAHDCGHGAFFPSRTANDFCGFWLGALSLTPYRYWQHTHNAHHATSGNLDRRGLGDVTMLTRREYEALPSSQKRAYRLARHPLVLLGIGPFLLFWIKHRFPWDLPRKYKKEWQSILATNGVLLAALLLAHVSIGIGRAAWVVVPTLWLAHMAGIFIFYVQHQFEHGYWMRSATWDFESAALKGSTFLDLPPLARWITGSIGYHHLHHLVSRIPNYQLELLHLRFSDELQPIRISVYDGIAAFQLKLWDEDANRMIPFPIEATEEK